MAPNRQEGRQRDFGFVSASRRCRPVLRVDRWSKEERRREVLVATLHAEVREEHLVKDQSRKGTPTHRARANEGGRAPRGRASQTRWSLGRGVRFPERRHDTGGLSGRTQQDSKSEGLLRYP